MANWHNEEEARAQIKALVADYYHDFKEKKEVERILAKQCGDRVMG